MAPSIERLGNCRVLIVGDAILDRYLYGTVDRISPEAPVPVVLVESEEERLGGAANVALNVQKLGAKATLLTVVGNDAAAKKLEEMLAREGVTARLGHDDDLLTTVKLRVIGRSQQLIRVDFENRPTHEILASMLAEFEGELPAHDVVLFSDYGKGGLTHITRMIEIARQQDKPVLVDPKGRDYRRYAGSNVITPNRAELTQVVGSWNSEVQLAERAHKLRSDLGLDGLLLTRSEEGMSLFFAGESGSEQLDVATLMREVFDVTGAGDTVIAVLAAMMACGLPLQDAVPIANRAGGIVVGKFGTASVSYEELFK